MNISNEDIGKRIRALRESKNMTIQNLADAGSCNYDHLQKAEKGKRGLGLNTLVMICHEFGITMDELVCGLQQPDPGISCFLEDIETIYEASKRLHDSAKYAGYFGILRRSDFDDIGLSCNQQLTEEERILMIQNTENCTNLSNNEYDSSNNDL